MIKNNNNNNTIHQHVSLLIPRDSGNRKDLWGFGGYEVMIDAVTNVGKIAFFVNCFNVALQDHVDGGGYAANV